MPMDLQIKKYFIRTKKHQLSLKDQHSFLQHLKRLIENGYPLLEALEVLNWDKNWSHQVRILSEALKRGLPLDQALHSASFNDKVVSFMYLSRLNGDLETSLTQCCLMLDQQVKYLTKFKQTIRYPFILLFLFLVLLYFVKTSVYPSFAQLFMTTSQSSKITDYSLQVINVLFNGSLLLISLLIVMFLCWMVIRPMLPINIKINIYKKIPLIRSFKKWQTTFLFSIQTASLLKAGFSLKNSLQTLYNQPQSPIISFYSEFIINKLQQGQHLTSILTQCDMFESELTNVFAKSTNNHTLVKDLNVYAEFIMERLQERITKLITLVQPVFFVLLAGLIILLYLSLMLPMFQLIQTM